MLLDYEKYEILKEQIETEKDKGITNAISSIMMIDIGNQHIYTKNMDSLTGITQSSVFSFNKAILADITKSYDELIKAIEILYNTGYKGLISKDPTLLGKKIKIFSEIDENEKYSINIFSLKEYECMIATIPSEYLQRDGNRFYFRVNDSYYDTKNKYKEKSNRVKILGFGRSLNYSLKEKKIIGSKDIVIGTSEPLVLKDCASYSQKYGSVSVKAKNLAELQSKLKVDYVDTFLQKNGNINIYDFIGLTKRVEQFTLGYYLDDPFFSPTKKSRYQYENNEYSKSVQEGRAIYEGFIDTYYSNIAILQGASDSDRDIESTKKLLLDNTKENNFLNEIFKKAFVEILSGEKGMTTIEELTEVYNSAYSATMKTIEKRSAEIDESEIQIYFSDSDSVKNEKRLFSFIERLKLIENNIKVYNGIIENSTIEKSNDVENKRMSIEEIEKAIKDFVRHKRASLFDNKIDSYVLNFRESKRDDEETFSDNVKILMDNNDRFKKVVKKLEKCKFHDYYEIDAEFMKNGAIEYLDKFADLLEEISIPAYSKTALKWRKLGNYRAIGIYFSGLIGEDFRSLSSYIHELTHHIDISANLNKLGRESLVNSLYRYFDSKIEDKREYYLSDVELIARAGEVAFMLQLGNYNEEFKSYKDGNISKEELLANIYETFKENKFSFLMEKLDVYKNNPVYLNVEELIKNEDFKLLNFVVEYFKSFYENKTQDIEKMLEQSARMGFTNRKLEGLEANASFRIKGKYKIEDKSKFPIPYEVINIDTSSKGTKKLITIDILDEVEREITKEDIERLKKELGMTDAEIVEYQPFKILDSKEAREAIDVTNYKFLCEMTKPRWISKSSTTEEKKYYFKYFTEARQQEQNPYSAISLKLFEIYENEITNSDDIEFIKKLTKLAIFSAPDKGYERLTSLLKKNKFISIEKRTEVELEFLKEMDSSYYQELAEVFLTENIDLVKEVGIPEWGTPINIVKGLKQNLVEDSENKIEIANTEVLSRITSYFDDIPLQQRYDVLLMLDSINFLNEDKKQLVLSQTYIENIGTLNMHSIIRFIGIIAESKIVDNDGIKLSTLEKMQMLKKAISDTDMNEIIVKSFISNAVKSGDFNEYREILGIYEDEIINIGEVEAYLPRFIEKTLQKKQEDKKLIEILFPRDLAGLNKEAITEKIKEIQDMFGKEREAVIVETAREIINNSNPEKAIDFAEKFPSTPIYRSATEKIAIMLTKELAKENLILDDVQKERVVKLMPKLILPDKTDFDKFKDFDFGDIEPMKVFKKAIAYFKENSDYDLIESLKKFRTKQILSVSKDYTYSYKRKGYIDELVMESLEKILSSSDLTYSELENFKSNKKVFKEDLKQELLMYRNASLYILSPKTKESDILISNKPELLKFMAKVKSEIANRDCEDGRFSVKKLKNFLSILEENHKTRISKLFIRNFDIKNLLAVDKEESFYELGTKVSYSLVVVNSIKSYLLDKIKNGDADERANKLATLCDNIGEKIIFEASKVKFCDKEIPDNIINSINKGVEFIEKIIEKTEEKNISIVAIGERDNRVVSEMTRKQENLNSLKQTQKIINGFGK